MAKNIALQFDFEDNESIFETFDVTNASITINAFTSLNNVDGVLKFNEDLVRVNCYSQEVTLLIFDFLKRVNTAVKNEKILSNFKILEDDVVLKNVSAKEIKRISLTESYIDTSFRFVGSSDPEKPEDANRNDEDIYAILQIELN